jgi:hypothetical protein
LMGVHKTGVKISPAAPLRELNNRKARRR